MRATSRFNLKLLDLPQPLFTKKGKAYPAPRSGKLAWFLVGGLPQPLPVGVDPEPSPVMGLIAEAPGLRGKVLGLVGWNATLMDVDGHSFFEGLNVRDESWVCYRGWTHDVPSQSGNLTPSTIALF